MVEERRPKFTLRIPGHMPLRCKTMAEVRDILDRVKPTTWGLYPIPKASNPSPRPDQSES